MKRLGYVPKAMEYAFGGVDGIPKLKTRYVIPYEKDISAGHPRSGCPIQQELMLSQMVAVSNILLQVGIKP